VPIVGLLETERIVFLHLGEPVVWVAGKLGRNVSKAAMVTSGKNGRFGSAPSLVMACGGLAEALKGWFRRQTRELW
jgi:hypothetical protein